MPTTGGDTWDSAAELPVGYRSSPTPDPLSEGRWWKFTATTTETLAFDTRDSTISTGVDPLDADTAVEVFTGADEGSAVSVAYADEVSRAGGYASSMARGLVDVTAGVEYHVRVDWYYGVDATVLSVTETYEGSDVQDPDTSFGYTQHISQLARDNPGWPSPLVVNETWTPPVALSRINTVWASMPAEAPVAIGTTTGNHVINHGREICVGVRISGVDKTQTTTEYFRQTINPTVEVEDVSDLTWSAPGSSSWDVDAFGIDAPSTTYTWLDTYLTDLLAAVTSLGGPVGAAMPNFASTYAVLRVSPTNTRHSGRILDQVLVSTLTPTSTWSLSDVTLTPSDYSADGYAYIFADLEEPGTDGGWSPTQGTIVGTNDTTLSAVAEVDYRVNMIRDVRPPTYRYIYAEEALTLPEGRAPLRRWPSVDNGGSGPTRLYPRSPGRRIGTY